MGLTSLAQLIKYVLCGFVGGFVVEWWLSCGHTYTVKNGVFQNSFLGCLYVHSSTTPNRVFLKPPFEGVTGHPQNTLTSDSESLKRVLCKYLHYINS